MDAGFYRALGHRVAALRRQKSWTQEDLAAQTQVGASYIARIETGSRRPTLEVLGQIAAALEVPIWRLLIAGPVSADESDWAQIRRELDQAVAGLSATDLRLLTEIARRFAD